jgi:hypothetical protein
MGSSRTLLYGICGGGTQSTKKGLFFQAFFIFAPSLQISDVASLQT